MEYSPQVQQSAIFKRAYKRLHPNQKADVDDAVADIVRDATIGEAKKGDLAGGFVHKFKCNGHLALLAYEYDPKTLLLLLLSSHENFYRDLKWGCSGKFSLHVVTNDSSDALRSTAHPVSQGWAGFFAHRLQHQKDGFINVLGRKAQPTANLCPQLFHKQTFNRISY